MGGLKSVTTKEWSMVTFIFNKLKIYRFFLLLRSNFIIGFLDWSDVNVVLVDWTKGTTGPEPEVVANAPSVGKLTAALVDWLSTLGIKHADVHIVGMSLGCHVAGWAGRSCQSGKIGYLTGKLIKKI